ncbi:hypothetical protein [Thermotoga sp.]|uniref:hypothetical protein n=1 Tax=Thermotoga sp. TaxID=28240 RepID=UPI0025F561B0|nr:hypothetical protein [Thermotoga sp.]
MKLGDRSIFDNELLYADGQHKFFFLGWEEKEEEKEKEIVQTNRFLILDGNEEALLNPDRAHVLSRVMSNITEITELSNIKHIFYTPQDPDVTSDILL